MWGEPVVPDTSVHEHPPRSLLKGQVPGRSPAPPGQQASGAARRLHLQEPLQESDAHHPRKEVECRGARQHADCHREA